VRAQQLFYKRTIDTIETPWCGRIPSVRAFLMVFRCGRFLGAGVSGAGENEGTLKKIPCTISLIKPPNILISKNTSHPGLHFIGRNYIFISHV
jgi:hypothetical protein